MEKKKTCKELWGNACLMQDHCVTREDVILHKYGEENETNIIRAFRRAGYTYDSDPAKRALYHVAYCPDCGRFEDGYPHTLLALKAIAKTYREIKKENKIEKVLNAISELI